jgi:tryptophan-rich sensory protein
VLTLDLIALAVAVAVPVGMAALGTVLAGSALKDWFVHLKGPRWQLPLWAFIAVGALGYLLDAVILYRLITVVDDPGGRVVALTALVVVMLYNELWNYACIGRRSTYAGWIGVLAFLAPLAILQVALAVYDRPSAVLILVYVVWVLAYDVPWSYALWRLNPDRSTRVDEGHARSG